MLALVLAVSAWAGCAGKVQPMIDPSFAARTYTPAKIAVLPPAAFMVLDQTGDNDRAASDALGRFVANELTRALQAQLRSRGYQVDLSARWDGIWDANGQQLVTAQELAWFANSVVAFTNGPAGGGRGAMAQPAFVAPELAAKLGWATQSDTLLYANLKGVVVTPGKRRAQVIGVVFFVVVLAALIALFIASQGKGGGDHAPASKPAAGGGATTAAGGIHRAAPGGATSAALASPAPSAPAPVAAGGGWRGGAAPPPPAPVATGPGGWRTNAGAGLAPAPRPGPVYGGPSFGFGVGVVVPVDEPVYTHEGTVQDEDSAFAGDQVWISLTLVSARDGRVLWHVRDDYDVDASKPPEIDGLVKHYLDALPPSLALGPTPAAPPTR